MKDQEVRIKDDEFGTLTGVKNGYVSPFYLKNKLLYMGLRWTRDRVTKELPWGRSKSCGTGIEGLSAWVKKLVVMKAMLKSGELKKPGVFDSFFEERGSNVTGGNKSFDFVANEWMTGDDQDALPQRKNRKGDPLEELTKYYHCVAAKGWMEAFSSGTGKSRVSFAISTITQKAVEKVLYAGWLAKAKGKTRAERVSVLRMILKFAEKRGYIRKDQNPIIELERIGTKKAEIAVAMAFKPEEIDPFLDLLRAEFALGNGNQEYLGWYAPEISCELIYNAYDFAFSSGCRPEEWIELQIGDIQGPGLIHISRSRVWVNGPKGKGTGRSVVKGNKDGDNRDVPLMPRGQQCIERQLALLASLGIDITNPEQHIFIAPNGKHYPKIANLQKWWNRVADRMWKPKDQTGTGHGRIRVRPLYSPRHTSISLQLMLAEKSGREVAQEHGHTEQTMEKDYAHWMRLHNKHGDNTEGKLAIYRFYRAKPKSEMTMWAELQEQKKVIAAQAAEIARLTGPQLRAVAA